jgi:hypothetical protein
LVCPPDDVEQFAAGEELAKRSHTKIHKKRIEILEEYLKIVEDKLEELAEMSDRGKAEIVERRWRQMRDFLSDRSRWKAG